MRQFKFLSENRKFICDDKTLLRSYLRRIDTLYREHCRIPSQGNLYQASIELYFQVQEFIGNEQLTTYDEVRSYYDIAYSESMDVRNLIGDEIHNRFINEVELFNTPIDEN